MRPKPYTVFQLGSAFGMILTLLWLTVATPFVYSSQQQVALQHCSNSPATPFDGGESEATNPFGNNTEEKTPTTSNSFSEEYIHLADQYYYFLSGTNHNKGRSESDYVAFHGELLSPPPEA